jgi:uncharacterized membrane protein YccF (DUF307 family)
MNLDMLQGATETLHAVQVLLLNRLWCILFIYWTAVFLASDLHSMLNLYCISLSNFTALKVMTVSEEMTEK